MEPLEFCRQMMAEYEEQWTEARGHQERHPLRAKMRELEQLIERVRAGEDFDHLLRSGCEGESAEQFLLCEDLRPRWKMVRQRTVDRGR